MHYSVYSPLATNKYLDRYNLTLSLNTEAYWLSQWIAEEVTLMSSHSIASNNLSDKIKTLLLKTPGLSVKELARASKVNRQFMAGFLAALEERGDVYSRKIGPARIYFNNEVKNNERKSRI